MDLERSAFLLKNSFTCAMASSVICIISPFLSTYYDDIQKSSYLNDKFLRPIVKGLPGKAAHFLYKPGSGVQN
jgi:hypothetical protein